MTEKTLWYRAASVQNPFGVWKLLPPEMESERVLLRHTETGKILCPVHCKWENYTAESEFLVKCDCGNSVRGFVVPWVLPKQYNQEFLQNRGVIVLTEEHESWLRKEREKINEQCRKESSGPCDVEGVPYDKVLFSLESDNDSCQVLIGSRSIDRDKFNSLNEGNLTLTKIPENAWGEAYFFKGHRFSSSSKKRLSLRENIDFYSSCCYPSKSDEKLIPALVIKKIEETTAFIVDSYCGRKITLSRNLFNGLDLLNAASHFPYEANMFMLACKIGFPDWLDRSDPNIFNNLCAKLGLKSFSVLRKIFDHNPVVVVWYKNLHDMGFRDVNIISDILSLFDKTVASKEFKDFNNIRGGWTAGDLRKDAAKKLPTTFFESINSYSVNKENDNPFIFFCGYSIPLRGERATWNSLNREPGLDKYYLVDTARMFCRYFTDLNAEERESVLKNGFTKRTHDMLSNIVHNLKHKNHVFAYTKEQKNLEDDIDGFTFKLPLDSSTMHLIGSSMHNCVFSYWEQVLNGSCTIVYAVKDESYEACIEVSGNRRVIQARSDYNGLLEGSIAEAFKKWKKRHRLI